MEYLDQALWETSSWEAGNLVTGFNQWNMVQVYRYICPDDNVNEFRSHNQEDGSADTRNTQLATLEYSSSKPRNFSREIKIAFRFQSDSKVSFRCFLQR